MKIVVLCGNPRPGSRTLEIATALAAGLAGSIPGSEVDELDLADVAAGMYDADDDEVGDWVRRIGASDLVIVASPTYKASYTGLLKSFLDRFGHLGLSGCVAVPLMTMDAPVHLLAADVFLRPVLLTLGASCPSEAAVVLMTGDLDREAWIADWIERNGPVLRAALQRH